MRRVRNLRERLQYRIERLDETEHLARGRMHIAESNEHKIAAKIELAIGIAVSGMAAIQSDMLEIIDLMEVEE